MQSKARLDQQDNQNNMWGRSALIKMFIQALIIVTIKTKSLNTLFKIRILMHRIKVVK